MKHYRHLTQKLALARPATVQNQKFTDAVMARIANSEINPIATRTTNEPQTKGLFMKLRTLPLAALVALIAVGALTLSGAAYATVKLIESLSYTSSTNEHNRTVIDFTDLSCPPLRIGNDVDHITRYEIKKDSGLSAEDAYYAVQARCEMDQIDQTQGFMPAILNIATVTKLDNDAITLRFENGTEDHYRLSQHISYVNPLKTITRNDITIGSTVGFRHTAALDTPASPTTNPEERPISTIILYSHPAKYYGDYQQYIRPVKQCRNNPGMDCVVPSSYNHVTLLLSYGGTYSYEQMGEDDFKQLQGKLVSYDATRFTLENNGQRVTFQTPYNIIEEYNQTGVYRLASMNEVYARTDPEALKIEIGDTLGVYTYLQQSGQSEIPWSQTGSIELMVERAPHNIDVLRKY